jgi:hypothetical protein
MNKSQSFCLSTRKIKNKLIYNDKLSFGSMPDLCKNPDISKKEFKKFERKNNEILKFLFQKNQSINSSVSSNDGIENSPKRSITSSNNVKKF